MPLQNNHLGNNLYLYSMNKGTNTNVNGNGIGINGNNVNNISSINTPIHHIDTFPVHLTRYPIVDPNHYPQSFTQQSQQQVSQQLSQQQPIPPQQQQHQQQLQYTHIPVPNGQLQLQDSSITGGSTSAQPQNIQQQQQSFHHQQQHLLFHQHHQHTQHNQHPHNTLIQMPHPHQYHQYNPQQQQQQQHILINNTINNESNKMNQKDNKSNPNTITNTSTNKKVDLKKSNEIQTPENLVSTESIWEQYLHNNILPSNKNNSNINHNNNNNNNNNVNNSNSSNNNSSSKKRKSISKPTNTNNKKVKRKAKSGSFDNIIIISEQTTPEVEKVKEKEIDTNVELETQVDINKEQPKESPTTPPKLTLILKPQKIPDILNNTPFENRTKISNILNPSSPIEPKEDNTQLNDTQKNDNKNHDTLELIVSNIDENVNETSEQVDEIKQIKKEISESNEKKQSEEDKVMEIQIDQDNTEFNNHKKTEHIEILEDDIQEFNNDNLEITEKIISFKIDKQKLRKILKSNDESNNKQSKKKKSSPKPEKKSKSPTKQKSQKLSINPEPSIDLENQIVEYKPIESSNLVVLNEQQKNDIFNHNEDGLYEEEVNKLCNLNLNQLPEGYIPLIMTPNGMIIPVDVLNKRGLIVKKEENRAMEVVPELTKGEITKITDSKPHSEEEMVEPLEVLDFDKFDQCAALSLYLLSKESKLDIKYDNYEFDENDKEHKEWHLLYQRLLQLEKLKFIQSYKDERNKLVEMLAKLKGEETVGNDDKFKSKDKLLEFEKDLMEMRDYEILRAKLMHEYNEKSIYLQYLNNVSEIESMGCLDYAVRLTKYKNYLNMEKERLIRNEEKIGKINTVKSQGIWNKYIQSVANNPNNDNVIEIQDEIETPVIKNRSRSRNKARSRGKSVNNNFNYNNINDSNIELISEKDFILLTNANSRSYSTYVLNNSLYSNNEGQREIIELVEYYLPDKSVLRELFKEVKRNDQSKLKGINDNKNKRLLSINSDKGNGMISTYGLKESNVGSSNRILKELQIDGMNVDINDNDRFERRGVGTRKSRNSNIFTEDEISGNTETGDGGISNNYNNNNTDRDREYYIDNSNKNNNNNNNNNNGHGNNNRYMRRCNVTNLSSSDESKNEEGSEVGKEVNNKNDNSDNVKRELNITSCLDTSLCDIDRVKMLNLNRDEIKLQYTRTYAMPHGLHWEEINEDLLYLREMNDKKKNSKRK